jgi:Fungal potassium channel
VFFVLKFNLLLGWKRLVLADTPRQTINALTLYAVWLIKKDGPGPWYDISKYFKGNSLSTSALTVTTMFTVLVCAGSLLFLLVAAICYVPLLCHIRGNLKVHFCSPDYLRCWLISFYKPRNIAATKWTRYGS